MSRIPPDSHKDPQSRYFSPFLTTPSPSPSTKRPYTVMFPCHGLAMHFLHKNHSLAFRSESHLAKSKD